MAVELYTLVDGTITVRDKRTYQLLGRIVPIRRDRFKLIGDEVYGKTVAELAERLEKRPRQAP